ncbi:MAG TPA: hypothetical protein VNG71_03630 [Pyrinomonadaceae bacterium]|nr:hypothetical protein [Pyrinomonadaceae bacterium]
MVIANDGASARGQSNDLTSQRGPERSAVAVLEWQAWEGFLLRHVLGDDALRIEVDPFREFPSAQFDRVCDSCIAVCFHINLSLRSRLPLAIRELTDRFMARGVYVINGFVRDIRKSALHAHLESIGLASAKAAQSGSSDEILFVKTDLNYGGELERSLPPESIAVAGLEHLISRDIGAYRYQTVPRKMIPESTWTDPAVVVEKYIANSEDSFYRVYFSGQHVIIVKAFAPRIIKKLSGDSRDTNFVTDLEQLKAGTGHSEISVTLKRDVATFVEHSPVEFGCIDIVHDGRDHHYIIDLNLTPYAGMRPHDPFLTNFLRMGITDPSRRKAKIFLDSPLSGLSPHVKRSAAFIKTEVDNGNDH